MCLSNICWKWELTILVKNQMGENWHFVGEVWTWNWGKWVITDIAYKIFQYHETNISVIILPVLVRLNKTASVILQAFLIKKNQKLKFRQHIMPWSIVSMLVFSNNFRNDTRSRRDICFSFMIIFNNCSFIICFNI